MRLVHKIPGYGLYLARRLRVRIFRFLLRPLFRSHGKNFIFDPDDYFSYSTISVGDDVYIGPGATLISTESTIDIGSKVMFGPGVTVIGGDHNSSQIGRFMRDVTEKSPGNDLPVIIEDDVWIGAEVVILKGITLRRGSIVAAGAVVTKSFPPYSIIAGVPARLLRLRWPQETIDLHEEKLYPDEKRIPKRNNLESDTER